MRYPTIDMKIIAGDSVLAGAIEGRAAFAAVLEQLRKQSPQPSPLLLDFATVEVATASFVREAVFALKAFLRASNSTFYPVVANVNDAVREELAVIADAKGDALLAVETSKTGAVRNQTIIGSLDPKQEMTFGHVTKLKRTDAGSLMAKYGSGEKTKSTTAWNNRLASLVSRGLILEYSHGRAKYYQPIFDEVH